MAERDEEGDWLAKVQAFATIIEAHAFDDLPIARKVLAHAYTVAAAAPAHLLRRFATFSASALQDQAARSLRRIELGNFTLELPNSTESHATLLALCAHLRALDDFVAQNRHDTGLPTNADEAWRVELRSGEQFFLIPGFKPRKTPKMRDDGSDALRFFSQAALRHHRIIPARIGTVGVDVECSPILLGRDDGPFTLGGALFPELTLQCIDHGDGFLVEAVECLQHLHVIEHTMGRGLEDDCAALVYPELTIDRAGRALILRTLRLQRPRPGRRRNIPLVVAGSWHEPDGDGYRNVAHVYDGHGKRVASHNKMMPFIDKTTKKVEDIKPGSAMTVLALGDTLVGIAICLDFCERRGMDQNPYAMLDVDLMLVPSFGNLTTVEGHRDTARDMEFRWRTETFLVQQSEKPSARLLGYVFAPGDNTRRPARETGSMQTWNLWPQRNP